jgi:hypothetical protein
MDGTLDDLLQKYGALCEEAGMVRAEISHRMRMLAVLQEPGEAADPPSPMAPFAATGGAKEAGERDAHNCEGAVCGGGRERWPAHAIGRGHR